MARVAPPVYCAIRGRFALGAAPPPRGMGIAAYPATEISEPSLRQGAAGTMHFEIGGASF
jgi:hypothetical protein